MPSTHDGEHSSGGRGRKWRKGFLALVGSVAVVASALPATTQAMAAPNPKPAEEPAGVSFTLEGCRNDGSISLPNGSGQYVCPDGVYTSGNLGKGWAELDLVPYRVTADAGTSAAASQTYTVVYAVDNEDAGKTGYDVLSAAVLNTTLSVGTCAAPVIGTQLVASPGIGGISKTLYRTLTVTQSRNTTCVYDFYARLAIGSHLFPGASLHANMALPTTGGGLDTGGIGARDVSIPVKEIEPQTIDKDMSGSRGSDLAVGVMASTLPPGLAQAQTLPGPPLDVRELSTDAQGERVTVDWKPPTEGTLIPG